MSSTSTPAPDGHPIVAFTHRLHRVLDTLSDTPTWSMTPAEHRAVLVGLARAGSRVEGLRLTVLAGADRADVAAETAATSTAAWVAHATRQPRAAAHADLHLAHALDTDHPTTRAALSAGTLDPAQARVIISALRALPDTVTPTDRARAEAHLITLAGAHDAKALRILGRRILEVLDPDAADEQEGRALEAEETTAARRTYLHIRDNHDGTHSGRFRIPDLHAAMLTTMLNALTSPAQHATGTSTLHPFGTGTATPTGTPTAGTCDQPDDQPGEGEPDDPPVAGAERTPATPAARVARPEVLGQALCTLLERFPTDRLPTSAGMSATVVVLLDYDKLLSGLGAAQLSTGHPISAAQARRLACEAGIVPLVYQHALGSPPVILDVGRKTRLHTEPQRIAMTVRDRGCTAENCDRPPGWCHAHHDIPWSAGGHTSLTNGRFLCPYHHHRAHSPDYHIEYLPTGQIRFHKRN